MVRPSHIHRSSQSDSGRQISDYALEKIVTQQTPPEDKRPFWMRLLTSVRVHIDLKKREAGIRGKADF